MTHMLDLMILTGNIDELSGLIVSAYITGPVNDLGISDIERILCEHCGGPVGIVIVSERNSRTSYAYLAFTAIADSRVIF